MLNLLYTSTEQITVRFFLTFFDIEKKNRTVICSDLFNRNYLKFPIFSKFLVVKTKNRTVIFPAFLDVF